MGTIVYEYKSRIMELENEVEKNNERMGIILCVAVLMIVLSISIIRSSAFVSAEPMVQSSILGGTVLTLFCAYTIVRGNSNINDVESLFIIGLALTVFPMMSMAM